MSNKLKNQQGQSMLELLVAMGIFVLVVSSVMFVVLDALSANRQGSERTQASLLATEGMEAALSIRNLGWKFLTSGDHGLNGTGASWCYCSERIGVRNR